MRGAPTTSQFWGKLEREGGSPTGNVIAWHPLVHHCADVAAVTEALLERTLIGRRLAKTAALDSLTPTMVARLCVISAMHDIGKCCHGFQNKASTASPRSGHVGEAGWLLANRSDDKALLDCLPLEAIAEWHKDGSLSLLWASIAHHGRPVHAGDCPESAALWNRHPSRDPYSGLRELGAAVRRWFPRAFEAGEEFPSSAEFQHAFAGLVMLADWLGSNRDEELFRFSDRVDEERIDWARKRAARAIELVGLDVRQPRRALGTVDSRRAFDVIKPLSVANPNAMQQTVSAIAVGAGPSIVVLESETGSGKTEAALSRFVRLFAAGEVDGLYFALPTRTAATQLFSRVRTSIERAFPDEQSRPPTVLAVPGYLRVDDRTGRLLPGFEVLWNDDRARAFRFRGWAAENSKRYLAGAVVVGTVDQALLSALSVDHAHLRATALSRHLLVVDEVHASDPYMSRVLEFVLQTHARAGGHALLMSATLATEALEQWLATVSSTGKTQTSIEQALSRPYPALTVWSQGARSAPVTFAGARDRGPIRCEMQPWIDEDDLVVDKALSLAERGARVIILRNTVNAAIATQRALERLAAERDARSLLFSVRGTPTLHHARFAREDRETLDRELEAAFGKQSTRKGLVVVATQTIQQSLDIDADVMLTDICPMDVLLQRIGRVHRHDRPREAGFEQALIVVLVPEERHVERYLSTRMRGRRRNGLGAGSVYSDLRVVQATIETLQARAGATLAIPADNRALVERSMHGDVLSAFARRGEAWKQHCNNSMGAKLADRRIAEFGCLQRCRDFGEFAFPTDSEGALLAIRTRLGEEDREVEFDRPWPGPFGDNIRSVRIPAWMGRDIVTNDDGTFTLDVSTRDATLSLSVGGVAFVYDRLGLRWEDADVDEGDVDDE